MAIPEVALQSSVRSGDIRHVINLSYRVEAAPLQQLRPTRRMYGDKSGLSASNDRLPGAVGCGPSRSSSAETSARSRTQLLYAGTDRCKVIRYAGSGYVSSQRHSCRHYTAMAPRGENLVEIDRSAPEFCTRLCRRIQSARSRANFLIKMHSRRVRTSPVGREWRGSARRLDDQHFPACKGDQSDESRGEQCP
jgi:hypothetical protein